MLTVKGRITEQGALEAELPKGVQPGEVSVTIEYETPTPGPRDAETWTDEELAELMKPGEPLSGHEILKLLDEMGETGWEHVDDGAKWVQEQREQRKRRF